MILSKSFEDVLLELELPLLAVASAFAFSASAWDDEPDDGAVDVLDLESLDGIAAETDVGTGEDDGLVVVDVVVVVLGVLGALEDFASGLG